LATLSRLTGDDRFEKAAYKAFFALWNRRSDIGLVGNTINIWTGVSSAWFNFFPLLTGIYKTWTLPEVTGIGAGVDSFYEYALKWYVMSGAFVRVVGVFRALTLPAGILQAKLSFLTYGMKVTLL
jgi:mannosidase alpha-like ER degradation enhancer 1